MFKILFVSIPSIHFFRWVEQINLINVELYYYNIRNKTIEFKSDKLKILNVNTYKSKRPFYGENYIKRKNSLVYQVTDTILSKIVLLEFEKILSHIKPDIVHSFELNTSSYPIISVLRRYKKIKFVYSSWGSDFYYFKNLSSHKFKIKTVLKRVNYLITDCKRDSILAKDLGFKNTFLDVYPGGGGYDLIKENKNEYFRKKEDVILIKGYENYFGRALNVLRAISLLKNNLKSYKIIIFSSNKVVEDFINKNLEGINIEIFTKDIFKTHKEFLQLYRKAKIYIGNSISDGMPNTLLEAITHGVFPIQSNPGGASSEVIINGLNGLLIEDCNNINEIKRHIKEAINNEDMIKNAFYYNLLFAENNLDRNIISKSVNDMYTKILRSI